MLDYVLSNWKLAVVFLITFIGTFLLSYYSDIIIKNTNVSLNRDIGSYFQNFEKKQNEIVLVYLGSSVCVYANQLEDNNLDLAKTWLSEIAKSKDMSFTSVGISVDWDIHVGLEHLIKVGNFDEVIIGNNWFNHGVIKYIGDLSQETFTPQIFILIKEYDSQNINRKIVDESLLLILKGKKEITDWILNPYVNFN